MMIGKIIGGIFGGGMSQTIENVASEWIETSKEKAEAAALMVKTLDPNGLMRRELSRRVSFLYTVYILTTLLLLCCEAMGWGPGYGGPEEIHAGKLAVSVVTEKVTALFTPITTLFGAIVTASFGVNAANSVKGK